MNDAPTSSIGSPESPARRLAARGASVSFDPPAAESELPDVFSFTNYREYLNAFFEAKKQRNPSYSQSLFARKAGLGANSRGYLSLVQSGKRNLTPHTLRGFVAALGLGARESIYFENLVFYNQARTPEDQEYYFQRLSASAEGRVNRQFELLASQYRYYSRWYYVAVLQLVGLHDFVEDPSWMSRMLRGKVSKKECQTALSELIDLGLVRRNESGRLEQSEPLVKFNGDQFHPVLQRFHAEMLDRAREALFEDPYLDRTVSSVTLSCDRAALPEIRRMIAELRDQITLRFGSKPLRPEAVIQVNFQAFHLTPVKTGESKS